MKRGLLLLLFLIVLSFQVNAQASYCYVATNCSDTLLQPDPSLDYNIFGYVSLLGHFSDVEVNGGVSYPYRLCCPDAFTLGVGDVAWKYSKTDPPASNGSGHVGDNDSLLPSSVRVGTPSCVVRDSCNADETCAFNLSDANGSHMASCYDSDVPVANSYDKSMCCKLAELCYDGIDNDLDGFIDCADSDCNDFSATNQGQNPQECTNFGVDPAVSSPFNTSACIVGYNSTTNKTIYNDSCFGQWSPPPPTDPYFYCGFGLQDDPALEPTGVCCPVGYNSFWNSFAGKWECQETEQCGVSSAERCGYDFDFQTSDWYSSVYDGDPSEWCNTQVTDLLFGLDDVDPSYEGSTGCCLIPKHGEINYWLDENNVRIWG